MDREMELQMELDHRYMQGLCNGEVNQILERVKSVLPEWLITSLEEYEKENNNA